jgi:glycosyltransferase involved in cell wall biosynthesis
MEGSARKKILLVITKSSWGGAQRYVYDIATGLDRYSYDAVIAAGGNGPLTEKLKDEGFKVYALSSLARDISLLREIRAFAALFAIVRAERPDVLHLNSSKAGFLGALIGRLLRVPRIIFTAHGWAFNEDRSPLQRFLLKTLHYATVLLSHTTIAVSESIKAEMDWPWAERKMRVIHPGRTITNLREKNDARGVLEMKVTGSKASLVDFHDDFWIGTIAELHPIKRLNRAIDALASLLRDHPRLRFIIIHDGELRAQLEEQVRNLGLEEHVFFTGTVEDAARYLRAFDLFVLPSKSEAFGYVILEAGIAQVPVVATRVGGIPDIIESGENGLLVPPEDTPTLAGAMRTLIDDERMRHEFAHRLNLRAQEFTVAKMIEATRALYSA